MPAEISREALKRISNEDDVTQLSIRRRIAILTFLYSAYGTLCAQSDVDSVFLDALAFDGERPNECRVDVLAGIPYSVLSFERSGGAYVGRYQARFRIVHGKESILDTVHVRILRTFSYDATSGRDKAWEFFQHSIVAPPGRIDVAVEIVDLRTSRISLFERDLTIPDFRAHPFSISSLMLVARISEDSSGMSIVPMLSPSTTVDEPFFLFFEVYNRGNETTAHMVAEIRDGSGTLVAAHHGDEKTFPIGRSQTWLRIVTTHLPHGDLTVSVVASASADTATVLARSTRAFTIDGGSPGSALNETELGERIAQLRYIASSDQMERIAAAKGLAERQRRYAEFWAAHDPAPETRENEAMDEYFRRIDDANRRYRSYAAGWLTDMGRIHVVYGPPDDTATESIGMDGKRTVVWHYRRRNLRIAFVDQNGFGDYRLATPIAPGEKFHYR